MKLKYKIILFLLLSYLTCLSSTSYSVDADILIENMNKAYDKINNYSVYFIKSELIENTGMFTEHIDLIFEKPFNIRFN
jgi:outer membrane lipoprotein-sorting protein